MKSTKFTVFIGFALAAATAFLYANERFVQDSALKTAVNTAVVGGLIAVLFRAITTTIVLDITYERFEELVRDVMQAGIVRQVQRHDIGALLRESHSAEVHLIYSPQVRDGWLTGLSPLRGNLIITLPSDAAEPRWRHDRAQNVEHIRALLPDARLTFTSRRPYSGVVIVDRGLPTETIFFAPYPSAPIDDDPADIKSHLIPWLEVSATSTLGRLAVEEADTRLRDRHPTAAGRPRAA